MSGGEQARLLGRWGERLVAEDLRAKGWRIVAVNYRCRLGGGDLIAENRRFIAFVEVKLRKNGQFGLPMEAVTRSKQQKLRAAAQLYLMEHPSRLQPRFDVAQVFAPQGMQTPYPRIEYVENAF